MSASIQSFSDCISDLERKNRTVLISLLLWLSTGIIFIGMLISDDLNLFIFYFVLGVVGYGIKALVGEYEARMIRAIGARVTPDQFPEIHEASEEVRQRFGVTEDIPIVIVAVSSVNALAIRFARKKMIVLFSEMVTAVKDNPEQLRFFLAHEMCHCVLDHGPRRFLELYKPAKFKRGRELTCDNAGVVAAGSAAESSAALAKLAVGKDLWGKLNAHAMEEDAREIMSGFTGWLLGRYLTHPPCGERVRNVSEFARRVGVTSTAQARQEAIV